jgi:hypothetical protein
LFNYINFFNCHLCEFLSSGVLPSKYHRYMIASFARDFAEKRSS